MTQLEELEKIRKLLIKILRLMLKDRRGADFKESEVKP